MNTPNRYELLTLIEPHTRGLSMSGIRKRLGRAWNADMDDVDKVMIGMLRTGLVTRDEHGKHRVSGMGRSDLAHFQASQAHSLPAEGMDLIMERHRESLRNDPRRDNGRDTAHIPSRDWELHQRWVQGARA